MFVLIVLFGLLLVVITPGKALAHIWILVPTRDGVDLALKLTTDMRVGFEGRRARARTTLREGETLFAALSWSEHEPPDEYPNAPHALGSWPTR